jgi:hypothetical protein
VYHLLVDEGGERDLRRPHGNATVE